MLNGPVLVMEGAMFGFEKNFRKKIFLLLRENLFDPPGLLKSRATPRACQQTHSPKPGRTYSPKIVEICAAS